jgi:tRNA A37 threonylcarbamoyladenosine biosynthesis protein TsaE
LKTSHFYSSHDTLQESLKHRLVVRKDLQHELDQNLKQTNLVLLHGVSGSGKT